jgi:AhpD family alkylhydroperoxidase
MSVSRVTPQSASGTVKPIYNDIAKVGHGWVPDFYQVLAHCPQLLEGFWKIQRELIFAGKVSGKHREMLNVFVSLKNRCEYCAYHHSAFGLRAGLRKEQLGALEDYSRSPLFDDLEKLLLRYAEEYLDEGRASPGVVDALKSHYAEDQMVELELIIGSVNLANHFVGAFGIEIEPERVSTPELEELRRQMRSRRLP